MGARDAPELREQVCVCAQSRPTPWTLTHQAPLSMGFSRQEFWSGFPQILGHLSPTHVHTMLTWGLRGRQEFCSEHGRREAGWGEGGRHPSPCCVDPAPHRRNRSARAHTHTHTHTHTPGVLLCLGLLSTCERACRGREEVSTPGPVPFNISSISALIRNPIFQLSKPSLQELGS